MATNNDVDALQSAIDMINAYGGTVTVTSKTYEYTSASGNSSTWKVETTYKYNRY